mgnify:CR=1 FL=1|tara:strand:+ start:5902 stop:6057 length:156 start_codon:yes stop_codon:yes gene_type:complete
MNENPKNIEVQAIEEVIFPGYGFISVGCVFIEACTPFPGFFVTKKLTVSAP